jgi:hypothetical protein
MDRWMERYGEPARDTVTEAQLEVWRRALYQKPTDP